MPIRSGVLSFGLVSIPVRVYPAIKDQTVRFHLLHRKCGNRIQNRWYCPTDDETVDRDDLIPGFQVAKNKYVQLSEEELESVEAESNRNIELKQFVPVERIDPVYFDNSWYLGAEKGGEKPYRLLTDALEKRNRAAVAQLVSGGKEQLVLIRPYENGLVMHTAYYADEIRDLDLDQIPKGDSARVSAEELKLSQGLIERLSDEFKPDQFKDEYRLRVLAMLEEKEKGEEITFAPEPKGRPAPTIDLMEALKRSMERAPARSKPARAKPATARKRRKKAS
jgi:DNA end-binding protein Ku